ncbi:MAG: RnfABCDGE type electron transport complex subunit D, partial [Niameybacter sp.]
MEKLLNVSSSPHAYKQHSVGTIMKDVIIALIPALLVGTYLFGLRALLLTIVCVVSCVAFEAIWQTFTHQSLTIKDLSAVVTGLLLAFNLPATAPVYVPIVGAFVAIVLAKQCFGGVGQNFINPALAARAFLLAAYPQAMTSFEVPEHFIGQVNQVTTGVVGAVTAVDAVGGATPLVALKTGNMFAMPTLLDAFLGNIGGCLGEVSALAILLGGLYLIYKKVITWHIPVCYLGTLFLMTLIFGGHGVQASFTSLF